MSNQSPDTTTRCEGAQPAHPSPHRCGRGTVARRLPPNERERQIVDGAIAFFARYGMDAQLRDLAKHLGITHPLLYRYFPTKGALVERVYHEFYARRWRPEWDATLRDATLPLAERLLRFYRAYLEAIDHPHWLRIFAFAGLRGEAGSRRYMATIRRRVIEPISIELRIAAGLPAVARPLPNELELAWGLHGEVCFLAIRNRILGMPVPNPTDRDLPLLVSEFLAGVFGR